MSEPQSSKSASFVSEQFEPIAYRVSWRHHSDKLVSPIRQSEQFRDFPMAKEAEDFAQMMRASYPHSVVSTKPLHLTRRKRQARNDARQWSMEEMVALPLQRRPKS
jgi:hypothetical protein